MARRISKCSSDNRVHPKPTTTRRRSEPTNPLLLWVGCGLKNDHPILYGSVAGWEKTRPARPMDSPKHQDGSGDGKEEEREAKEDTYEGREEEAGVLSPCVSPVS